MIRASTRAKGRSAGSTSQRGLQAMQPPQQHGQLRDRPVLRALDTSSQNVTGRSSATTGCSAGPASRTAGNLTDSSHRAADTSVSMAGR